MSTRRKIYIIYALLITYAILGPTILTKYFFSSYISLINPLFWLVIFLLAVIFTYPNNKYIPAKEEKTQKILIIIIIYCFFHFFLGLLVGFGQSPYSHSLIGIISNTWVYILVIVFKENVRAILVSNSKKGYLNYLIILILFIVFDLNFNNFSSNFADNETIFKFSFSVVFLTIAKNVLLMFLARTGGAVLSLTYLLPPLLIRFLMPVLPKHDWFLSTLLELILILIIYFPLYNLHVAKTEKRQRTNQKASLPKLFLSLGTALLFVGFVAGFFKYMPVAVMSNSMADVFYRGDIVIIEKINKNSINKIQVNDIIKYKLDNNIIIHRVISIDQDDDSVKFITKGDNNEFPDSKVVKSNQVKGIVHFRIPKIGYPSVMLNEFFNSQKDVGVET